MRLVGSALGRGRGGSETRECYALAVGGETTSLQTRGRCCSREGCCDEDVLLPVDLRRCELPFVPEQADVGEVLFEFLTDGLLYPVYLVHLDRFEVQHGAGDADDAVQLRGVLSSVAPHAGRNDDRDDVVLHGNAP